MRYLIIGPNLREAEGHAYTMPRGLQMRAMSVDHALTGGLDIYARGETTILALQRCSLHRRSEELDAMLGHLSARDYITVERP
jgi:hypothetical protein